MDDLRKRLYDDLMKKAKEKRARAESDLAATPDIAADDVDENARQRALNQGLLQAANRVGGIQGPSGYDAYAENMQKADVAGLRSRAQAQENLDSADQDLMKRRMEQASALDEQAQSEMSVDPETRDMMNQTLKKLGYGRLQVPEGMTMGELRGHSVFSKMLDKLPDYQMKLVDREMQSENLRESRAQRAQAAAEVRAQQESMKREGWLREDAARKEKRAQELRDRLDKVTTDTERKHVEFSSRKKNIEETLNALKTKIGTYGTVAVFGPEGNMMDSMLYDLAVDYAKLVDPDSVAREGEVQAVMQKLAPIRKSVLGISGAGVKNDTAVSILNGFQKMVDQRAKIREKEILTPIQGAQSRINQENGELDLNDPGTTPKTSEKRRLWKP